jgi:hypothetical protein
MVLGWSTYGKLACPYCIDDNKEFTLINGGKTSSFFFLLEVLAKSSSI